MPCEGCKNEELIEGTLEEVSFKPSSEGGKFFSSGVYGITVQVCPECGNLSNLCLDVKTLKKIIK